MGHHAAAYTLETYGHLIDDELGRHSSSKTSASVTVGHRAAALAVQPPWLGAMSLHGWVQVICATMICTGSVLLS
ncbi:MAG: hypothetical protein ACRDLF_07510 [Solirubrobacteraceae bacterium]